MIPAPKWSLDGIQRYEHTSLKRASPSWDTDTLLTSFGSDLTCVCVCARRSHPETTCGALLWRNRQLRGHTGSIRGGSEWHGGIFLSHNYKLYIPVTHVSVNSLRATNPPADVTDPSHDAKNPDRHLPRSSSATCNYDMFAASKIPGGDVY